MTRHARARNVLLHCSTVALLAMPLGCGAATTRGGEMPPQSGEQFGNASETSSQFVVALQVKTGKPAVKGKRVRIVTVVYDANGEKHEFDLGTYEGDVTPQPPAPAAPNP